jgi:putative ATP-dependent endonuclease of OLD family
MIIREVTVQHYRGWKGPVTWTPDKHATLLGPNSGGKSSLLRVIDMVLNPHRNAYREAPDEYDFYALDTSRPIEISVVIGHLADTDCDVFEEYLEGRRPDGTFGEFDDPHEEFDANELVVRMHLRAEVDAPAHAVFARPDAGGQRVSQEHKLLIGWHLVPAGLDPLHELAFYRGSVFARLFERVDLTKELEEIRRGIESARAGLMANTHVADTRAKLEEAALRLNVTSGADPFDLHVLSMSDRRVLRSLEPVLRGRGVPEYLPLASHGGGALRILLLAAVMQQARLDNTNLILAVEEPEQNLEPSNQRLVTRRMLFAESSGAAQVLISTHSPAVLATRPLDDLHLVREDASGLPAVTALKTAAPADHKFFERHARSSLTEGLYASAVVLVEGPTEVGGLTSMWSSAVIDDGLDERKITLIDCESIEKMEPFARFFKAVGVPVAAICDCEVHHDTTRAKIVAAGAELLITWKANADWEGVLAAEADIGTLSATMDTLLEDTGGWARWEQQLRSAATRVVADPGHVTTSRSIATLVAGYPTPEQNLVLASILRAKEPSWKTVRQQRQLAEALTSIPATFKAAMDHVHLFVEGNTFVKGTVDL